MFKQKIAITTMALAFSVFAQAAVVGNGPPNQTGGSDMNSYFEADTFTVASTMNVTKISFWSLQVDSTDYAGSTFWGVYANNAGAPGTLLFSGTPALTGVATGNTTAGLNEYMYTYSPNFTLNAGTYWFALHNGLLSTMPSTNFYWAWSADSGNSLSEDLSLGLASPWNRNDASLAFQLVSAPEPSTLMLSAAGLLAAILTRRKLSAIV